MEWIKSLKIILFAILEGITEWLPVSSTGHMLLLDRVLPLSFDKAMKDIFLYTIQFGAVLAVVALFWKKLFPLKKAGAGIRRDCKIEVERSVLQLWGKVLLACVPSLVGLFFDLPESPILIATMLIFYGVLFLIVETKNKHRNFRVHSVDDISYQQALIIGIFQTLAILPGTSRSGVTILGALFLGISRPAGAEFTFFLAVPTMAGASLLKIFSYLLSGGELTLAQFGYLALGAIFAFAVSMIVIRMLMRFVQKHDFKAFGIYRIALGILVLFTIV